MEIGQSQKEILSNIYYQPNNPAGFASSLKLFNAAKKEIPSLTHEQVKRWLKSQLTYTLHAQARRKFVRNPIIVSKIDEQWEADLVEMQEFSRQNNGQKYILTVIDCFSKYAWARALPNKSAKSVTDAFKEILSTRSPDSLRTDKGKEFINKTFQDLLSSKNIRYYSSNNPDIKCAIVERFNRTLKTRMFRYFTSKGTRKFIDVLQQLIIAYNGSLHRSIGVAPKDVDDENSASIFKKLYGKTSLREIYQKTPTTHKIKIGDEVRMKYKIGPFEKGFYPNWTDHVYKISAIDKASKKPIFTLDGYDGTKIENRKFYEEELQKVYAEVHRIEKILKRRIYKGKPQYFVKWLGYPSSYNSWIDATAITTISQ
ncbi:uncharacterized protein LOC128390702 [Panonychus citri]|uniref:uncharacterized protein LOC128390702 n=1 Tax=Panonychus citri TaxID=50023 RepID=UPI0023071CF6|nr:uncharacterized protein LOC128390702 [Panonychus citri]